MHLAVPIDMSNLGEETGQGVFDQSNGAVSNVRLCQHQYIGSQRWVDIQSSRKKYTPIIYLRSFICVENVFK